ncbi:MAG TPA: hypothetical protein VGG65_06280, partial [Thermoanaerobaculia bacterium]
RINLQPDSSNDVGLVDPGTGQITGYAPFLLYNGCATTLGSGPCLNREPIFFEPSVVFMGGSINPPTLGVGFGTGNRAELTRPNTQTQGMYYIIDGGQTARTTIRTGSTTPDRIALRDITPPNAPCPTPYDPASCVNANGDRAPGFVLDYASINEKTTSTVFSTQGILSVVTFTPDSVSPCATNGSSFQYRFFFLTAQGPYGSTHTYADYQDNLGEGFTTRGQYVTFGGSPGAQSATHDVFAQESHTNDNTTTGTLRNNLTNWKEQQ